MVMIVVMMMMIMMMVMMKVVNYGFEAQFFLLNNQLTLSGSYTVALYT